MPNSSTVDPAKFHPALDSEVLRLAKRSIQRAANGQADFVSETDETAAALSLEQMEALLVFCGRLEGLAPGGTNQPLAPISLDRFQIFEELGRGGFGIVLRAFDSLLEREVALKIPHPDRLVAGYALEEFVREAKTVAHLDHPGIVRVYDAGRIGPLWFITSTYCEGPTLAEWIEPKSEPLAPKVAASLLAKIVDAVHYAHSRGILHLDLKPDNVLLKVPVDSHEEPIPLVTDFGLARRSDAQESDSHEIGGTLAYMAPEQRCGDASRIGVTTDVYALGMILYELLNGKTIGETANDKANDTAADGRLAHQLQFCFRSIHADLAAICRRCLASEPDQRYGSARELAEDLQRYLRGECVSVRPVNRVVRMLRWSRRHPAVAALAMALFASGVATVVFSSFAANDRARFEKEQLAKARVAQQMESTLLHLARLQQERKFQTGSSFGTQNAASDILHSFHQELSNWSTNGSEQQQFAERGTAASHSLAMTENAAQLSHDALERELMAGVTAWRQIIAAHPAEPQWRRALAIHLLTYGMCAGETDWLWLMQRETVAKFGADLFELVREDYAQVLLELGITYNNRKHRASAHPVLMAAKELLQINGELPKAAARQVALVLVHRELAEIAFSADDYGRADQELDSIQHLVAEFENGESLDVNVAMVLATTYQFRYRIKLRTKELEAAAVALESCRRLVQLAVDAKPLEIPERIYLSDTLRFLARVRTFQARHAEADNAYAQTVAVLSQGIEHHPNYREFYKLRAASLFRWGDVICTLKDNDRAVSVLEQAAADFRKIEQVKQEQFDYWMHYVYTLQKLGRLYQDADRPADAVERYRRSVEVLKELTPRKRNAQQYAKALAAGEQAVAALQPERPQ